MKTFVVLILTVVALFVWQRSENSGKATVPTAATQTAATPAPVAQSSHNWAKNSLDRTHEAIDQVSRMRQESQQP